MASVSMAKAWLGCGKGTRSSLLDLSPFACTEREEGC